MFPVIFHNIFNAAFFSPRVSLHMLHPHAKYTTEELPDFGILHLIKIIFALTYKYTHNTLHN